jgi:hypothetical protein
MCDQVGVLRFRWQIGIFNVTGSVNACGFLAVLIHRHLLKTAQQNWAWDKIGAF